MSLRDLVPSQKIYALVKADKYDEALSLIDSLLAIPPENPWLWRIRSYVNTTSGNNEDALADIDKAIASQLEETDFYFTRGRVLFEIGRFADAVNNFTKVIEISLSDKNDYYLEAAYLHRADAYIRLGDFKLAKSDCQHIKDQTRLWTDRLRTKTVLLNECQ